MATIKQKKAIERVVENGGNVSQAMIDVGYSPNTAHTPQKLTESDGWKELLNEYLPKSLVMEKHRALLNKKDKDGDIDVVAVKAGVDMGHKIWGTYAPEKKDITTLGDKLPSGFDIQELADRMAEEIKKNI